MILIEGRKLFSKLQNGILYHMSGHPVGEISTQRIEELHLQPDIYILNGKKIMAR